MMKILDLNDDCLMEIFHYLDMYDLVNLVEATICFKQNARQAFLMNYKKTFVRVFIRNDDEYEKMSFQTFLRHFGGVISKLSIHEGIDNPINYALCDDIIKFCSSTLPVLRFKYLGEDAQKKLCQLFPRLKKMYFYEGRLYKNTTQFTWCPQISHLEFDNVKIDDPDCIQRLFPHLVHFAARSIDNFTDANIQQFFKCNSQLKSLNISNCVNITDNILHFSANKLPDLQNLELYKLRSGNNNNLQTNPLNFTRLKKLTLETCPMSLHYLTSLADGDTQLNQLILKMYDQSSNDELINSICKLKKLTVVDIGFDSIGEEHITRIASKLDDLLELTICGRTVYVNANAIIQIVQTCKHLTALTINSTKDSRCMKFNTDFHENLSNIVQNQNRGKIIKLIIHAGQRKIEITKEMITENGWVLCWKGYQTKSTTNLLDLGDKCLTKIFTYLADGDLCMLADNFTLFKHNAREAFTSKYKTKDFRAHLYMGGYINGIQEQDALLQYYRSAFRNFTINHIIITRSNNRLADRQLCELVGQSCSQTITKMSLGLLDEDDLFVLCQPFPRLTKLNIQACRLSPAISEFSWCTNLTHLEFADVELDNADECIGRLFPHLEHFCVDDDRNFENGSMQKFIKSNPQLKSLVLKYCRLLTVNIFEFMDNTLPLLERLHLNFISSLDEDLRVNSVTFKKLKVLTIHRFEMTSSILAAVATGSDTSQLNELKLGWDTSDDYLIDQICKFQNLERLSMHIFDGITAKHMIELVTNLSKLMDFSLLCTDVEESTYAAIEFANHFKHLEKLHLDDDKRSKNLDLDVYLLHIHYVLYQDVEIKITIRDTDVRTDMHTVIPVGLFPAESILIHRPRLNTPT